MRSPSRIAISAAAVLAAATVTVSTVAGPAAADEVPTTTATDQAPEYVVDPDVVVAPAGGDGAQTQASKAWSAGTEKDPDGKWLAYIEVAGGFVRLEVGTYETRREARKAAKAAAKEANGFMAGPGCDDPLVLC